MRGRSIIVLGVAVAMGGASVAMLQGWLNTQLAANTTPVEAQATIPVVVARTPLPFGARLHRENLQLVDWPADSVPAGTFNTFDELLDPKTERVVLRTMEPSEPVLASKVSGLGGRATLSTVVAKENRAVTIRVNDVLGVAGFVLPGDRVDIMLTRSDLERRTSPTTDILLQNVRVLGIDQDASDRKDKPTIARAVTVEVAPEQAQKLTLGAQVGVLSLALRNQGDSIVAEAGTIGLADLGTLKAAKPAPVRKRIAGPSGVSVRILRGTDQANYTVRRE